VAFALADAGFATVGLDFSGPMLAVAEQRLARRAAGNTGRRVASGRIQFLRGDAQQLPFDDHTFDVVTISYGLRNLTRWEAGLSEMIRVAKRGGRLLVLDFGKPDNRIWRACYFTYLRGIVPLFGRVFCGDAQTHSYILESLQHYPAQHGVAQEMRRLGCSGVGIVNLLGGVMTINHGIRPAPVPAPAAS
jgi:demethylmenaquinone methyltransferase/2-methoxy-6-polyprenyl-1,4-benzoquinol methylase